jgi:hypothetical protein
MIFVMVFKTLQHGILII